MLAQRNDEIDPTSVYYLGTDVWKIGAHKHWCFLTIDAIYSRPSPIRAGSILIIDNWAEIAYAGLDYYDNWREALRGFIEHSTRRADILLSAEELGELPSWLLRQADLIDEINRNIEKKDKSQWAEQKIYTPRGMKTRADKKRLNKRDLIPTEPKQIPWLVWNKVPGYLDKTMVPPQSRQILPAEREDLAESIRESEALMPLMGSVRTETDKGELEPHALSQQATPAPVHNSSELSFAQEPKITQPHVLRDIQRQKNLTEPGRQKKETLGKHTKAGLIHLKAGGLTDAESEFTKAINRQEGPLPVFMRGIVKMQRKQSVTAFEDFDKYLKLASGTRGPIATERRIQALLNRSRCNMELGRTNRALDDLQLILNERPRDKNALKEKVIIMLRVQEYTDAMVCAETILSRDKESADGYYYRAIARLATIKERQLSNERLAVGALTAKIEEALADISEALKYSRPNNSWIDRAREIAAMSEDPNKLLELIK